MCLCKMGFRMLLRVKLHERTHVENFSLCLAQTCTQTTEAFIVLSPSFDFCFTEANGVPSKGFSHLPTSFFSVFLLSYFRFQGQVKQKKTIDFNTPSILLLSPDSDVLVSFPKTSAAVGTCFPHSNPSCRSSHPPSWPLDHCSSLSLRTSHWGPSACSGAHAPSQPRPFFTLEGFSDFLSQSCRMRLR